MHCDCCDALLTEEERRIKLMDGSYANTCRVCLDAADIEYKLPIPFYEDEVVVDPVVEEPLDIYGEDYWNER